MNYMEMNIESALKQALVEFQNRNAGQVKGQCLTDNKMAAVIDGTIHSSVAKRDVILEHLLSCPKCFHEIKETLEDMDELESEGLLTPPEKLVQSAMALVSVRPPLAITNLKITCYSMARAGKTASKPPKMIKKISFTSSKNGFAYLLKVKKSKVDLLVSGQKVYKGKGSGLTTNAPLALSEKKRLVLMLSETPVKDMTPFEKIILITFEMSPEKRTEVLSKEANKRSAIIKVL